MRHNKLWIFGLSLMLGLALTACGGAATPETITVVETVEVEKVVTREVEIEKIVTQEVEVTVETVVEIEKEVVVTATPQPNGGQIIYALYQEPEILNPYLNNQTAAREAYIPVIEGLLNVNPDGEYIPALAETVPSVQNGLISEDGLTVTYPLKQDVRWSDGEPFSCDDVLFTYEVVLNPDSGAINTAGYDTIAALNCVDDYTAQLTFSEFYAPHFSLFTAILPRHATGDPAEMTTWVYNWHPVGTGPYKIQEWVPGDQISYVPNPNYRDYPAKPGLEKLVIRIVPSQEVGKALIRTGEIDILWSVSEADVPEFEDIPDVVVNKRPGPSAERLLLNLADPTIDATDDPLNNPHWALGDVRVRQAIEAAIDKQLIVDTLLYGQAPVGTSELSIGWAKGDISAGEYNPDTAMTLLADAGWTDEDGDGVRECNGCELAEAGRPLQLKIQTTTGNKLREEVEQVLVEMLAEVGVDLYIENIPSAVLFGSWTNNAPRRHGTFDILMYATSERIDPHSLIENYFASWRMPTEANNGGGSNFSRWVNDTADAAIEAAGASPDLTERQAAYQIVQEQIAAEVPHIYLYDKATIHLTRSDVTGFEANPWANQTWNVADWGKAQ